MTMLVLVDQDGVLADYAGGFDTAWQKLRAHHPEMPYIPASQATTFYIRDQYPPAWHYLIDQVQRAPGFFLGLTPIPGAVQAMRELVAAGHDVRICTAPMSDYENCVLEKHQWVEQHLGRDWVKRIVLGKDKTLVRGDVLIDDKPNVTGLLEPTWTHVLFEAPYNQGLDMPRVNWSTYQPVLAAIEEERAAAGLLTHARLAAA